MRSTAIWVPRPFFPVRKMSVAGVSGDHFLGARNTAVGEIIAFRAWKVVEGGPWPILGSFSFPYAWIPGSNKAEVVPKPNNTSGFYALKDYNGILDYWGVSAQWYCLGAVELWGEVIEGELGYRAEYAAVQNIVSLVRAGKRAPRVINGTPAWRNAVKKEFRHSWGYPTMDTQAVGFDREYDSRGKLITELRNSYLK